MKRFILLIFIVLVTLSSFAQRLTLTDLTNLCNKKNWEDVNQTLLAKGWVYYDSEKGSTYKYNTITWSFNKDYYKDKAQGWFYLYTYESFPNKISYTVLNKESYSLIQNSISSAGFKLVNSEIEDNEVISTYGNTSYTLKISTEKRKDDDWSDRSLTAYNITLIKKAGIYDPDNGAKTDYYYDGYSIQAEYTLKNGMLNGTLKSYYQNGNLKKTGNYINGKENGLFKEYNEDGSINIEYNMKDGVMNGAFKTYYENGQVKKIGSFLNGKGNGNFKEYAENGDLEVTYSKINDEYNGLLTIYEAGKVAKKINYQNGVRDGLYTEFTYGDNDTLLLEYSGLIKNELKDGAWYLYLYREGKKEVAEFTTFKSDIKNGSFKAVQGDSLIFGSYSNNKLDGDYIVYIDFTRMLFGGIIRTDTSNMNLLCKGRYYNDLKTGEWKYFDLTGSLSKTGRYSSDKKTGKWSYYYTKYVDNNSNPLPYSGELFLTETYENGIKNGLSERFSSLEEVKYLCDTSINKNVNPLDTCTKQVYKKEFQSFYYKNDELHGPCVVKDSIGNIIFKGNFIYGKKDGEWLESSTGMYINDAFVSFQNFYVYSKGNYTMGLRTGIWKEYENEEYIWETSYYSNGKLNGEMINYLENGGKSKIKKFKNGFLEELIVFDSLGYTIVGKYEILNETDYNLKVRKSEYNKGVLSASLEYYLKKDDPVLNYDVFDLMFMLKTNENSDGDSGYPDGELILYDENGNVKIQGKLRKEDKIGIWKYNFPEQGVQIQIEYTNNEPGLEKYFILNTGTIFNGIFKFTDDENNINEERKIKDGLRNGKTVYIDLSTGKIIKKEKYENGKIK